jgi:hypothetical protein
LEACASRWQKPNKRNRLIRRCLHALQTPLAMIPEGCAGAAGVLPTIRRGYTGVAGVLRTVGKSLQRLQPYFQSSRIPSRRCRLVRHRPETCRSSCRPLPTILNTAATVAEEPRACGRPLQQLQSSKNTQPSSGMRSVHRCRFEEIAAATPAQITNMAVRNILPHGRALPQEGLSVDQMCQAIRVFGRWLGPESNRRHEDFQSSALPTELPSRREGPEECTAVPRWQGEFSDTKAGWVLRKAGTQEHRRGP